MNFYTTYIHTCPLDDITFGLSFSYTVVGKAPGEEFSPYREGEVTAKLTDPRSIDQAVRLAVIADWAPLITNPLRLTDVLPFLLAQVQEQ